MRPHRLSPRPATASAMKLTAIAAAVLTLSALTCAWSMSLRPITGGLTPR